ncbi:MAG: hypothetical protein IAI49_16945, partial [Candidatus Eremiobacteraeota bacterium]|nr:hypothetical protein [Candidatus Eremiobacteraeota bacterium]
MTSGPARRARGRAAFVAGLAGLTALAGPAARAMDGPFEAARTRIEVRLTERLSSQDAKTGDIFHFDTISSTMI